ncbi:N-formylglutamate deformylase [Gluconacetobacter azotocaptans]|uniref:N-formylglutamate deformylase n=1 Tax=Gluconacetobacter azotocaptans TaxID=142834 RepID=UPI00195A72FD|nr:N-formylglutamate deformylase [Gluconacetobacter azotocaptans]MBM9400330.1 N-formylglutamate deformylase [Gluconacetobacter azotocaptans]
MTPPVFSFTPGTSPVLVTLPHAGTALPPGMEPHLTPRGRMLPDTDWYMGRLYAGALARGAGVLRANYSRYVVDLNRGADDAALYPGRPSTGLAPLLSFDGDPLYVPGQEPDAAALAERTRRFWAPYHDAVTAELVRLRGIWGWAVLWDGHSIRSECPRLFEGVLPDLNLGTYGGRSCDAGLTARLVRHAEGLTEYTHVLNGRFQGGYTTRQYGQPSDHVHAVQLEIAQSAYLASEDAPWPADPAKEARLRAAIDGFLDIVIAWRPHGLA